MVSEPVQRRLGEAVTVALMAVLAVMIVVAFVAWVESP